MRPLQHGRGRHFKRTFQAASRTLPSDLLKPSSNRPKLIRPSGDSLRSRRTSERNRKPVRQPHRSLRSNRCRSRYRSTCCDGRGCGSGSGGSRGNRGPGSDGSTWCRSRCRNRTTVRRRTTAQRHRSGRRRSERHRPGQRHRSAQQPHRSLRSRSVGSSCRGPTCDQAEQPP